MKAVLRKIASFPDRSSLQFVLGRAIQTTSSSSTANPVTITFTYFITPPHPGEYIIPALPAEVDGQSAAKPAVEIDRNPAQHATAQAVNSGHGTRIHEIHDAQRQGYLGEIITGELQLYLRSTVQNADRIHLTSLPADGLTIGKIVHGEQPVRIGNRIYNGRPLLHPADGHQIRDIDLGPLSASLIIVLLPSAGRTRSFGDFPVPFFISSSGEPKQISFASDTVTAQALALPAANRPANFNGAVGSIHMAVSAGPTNVAVGDPITVRVQISGHGALDMLTLPDQPAWHDFKTFRPRRT